MCPKLCRYWDLGGLAKRTFCSKVDIWHRSVRAQALNPSKMYLIDPALKYAMSSGEDRGRMLENAVFLHLRRQGLTPHYVLDKQEIDFFWENGQPVNVCLDFETVATREREIKGMTAALQMLNLPVGRMLTRDRNEEIRTEDKTILVQPAWSYFFEKN